MFFALETFAIGKGLVFGMFYSKIFKFKINYLFFLIQNFEKDEAFLKKKNCMLVCALFNLLELFIFKYASYLLEYMNENQNGGP